LHKIIIIEFIIQKILSANIEIVYNLYKKLMLNGEREGDWTQLNLTQMDNFLLTKSCTN
jgi:hypothetical protein